MYDIYSFGQTFSDMVKYLGLDSLKSNQGVEISEII